MQKESMRLILFSLFSNIIFAIISLVTNIFAINYLLIAYNIFLILFTRIERAYILLVVLIPFQYFYSTIVQGLSVFFILEWIIIIKFIFSKKYHLHKSDVLILILIGIPQLLGPVYLFNMPLLSIFNLITNFIMIFVLKGITSKISMTDKSNDLDSIIIGIQLSLLSTIIISFFGEKSVFLLESWERYEGLWNDPNFFSLFILISIAFLVAFIWKSKMTKTKSILSFFMLILLLFFGLLSYSRTFLFILSILILIFAFQFFTSNKKVHFSNILLFSIILLVLSSIFVFSALRISELRGLIDFSNNDWTNGRIESMFSVIAVMQENPLSYIFGFGFDNIINNMPVLSNVAHNTIIDIFSSFGLFVGLFIFLLLFRYFRKYHFNPIKNPNQLFYLILLLYSLTLSMLTNDFMYLFLGILPLTNYSKKEINVYAKES